MSKIEANTIDSISGTSTLTLGSSNASTIALGSGDVQSNFLYPAFEAYLASDQSVSNDTYTKVTINTEVLDTGSMYDNSTNYRFTPTVPGKYFIYGSVIGESSSNAGLQYTKSAIYKNGSVYKEQIIQFTTNYGRRATASISANIDFNGSSDYVELYGSVKLNSGSATIEGNGTWNKGTYFGAYRIGT